MEERDTDRHHADADKPTHESIEDIDKKRHFVDFGVRVVSHNSNNGFKDQQERNYRQDDGEDKIVGRHAA